MTDNDSMSATKAVVSPIRAVSSIWIVPIAAFLIGAWMVYHTWSNLGPLITIEFATASGLEAGKTKIKTRNVDIGDVESIELKEGLTGVIVTARLSKTATALLTEETRFWVVSPKVSSAGISGLNTLLSGPFIELSPGIGEQSDRRSYVGLENAPVTPIGTPGLHVTLESNNDFTFSEGDPVLYRGFKVGTIEDVYFNIEERMVYYNAFVEAPYHNLVTGNTRFWRMGGLSVDLSANGLKVQTGTLETLIGGGVAFEVPEDFPVGQRITQRAYFKVHSDYDSIYDHRFNFSTSYILHIDDNISGLTVGAPVEFRGVTIGRVTRTDIGYGDAINLLDKKSRIPVMISLEPGRMGLEDSEQGVTRANSDIERWIQEGLKATLKTGNLLIGSQLVELNYYEDQPIASIETFNSMTVIPVAPDDFTRIGSNISELINTLNNLPLEALIDNANQLLFEGESTFEELSAVAKSLESVMSEAQAQHLPKNFNATLTEINALVQTFSEGSQTHNELRKTLASLNAVLIELEPVLTLLNNQPNSLIFSGQRMLQMEPKKAQ
jgi:paraquat-inducible protein B